jgi:hypothetical protein
MRHVGVFTLSIAALLILSCGSGRQLESITVAQTVKGNQITFTATGTYSSSPTTVTPLAVQWGIGPFAPPPHLSYTLTTQPFVFTCPAAGSLPPLPVTAFAPPNPSAPATGTLPFREAVIVYAAPQCP